MRIIARGGNRLHAPEDTRAALISAYTSGADAVIFRVQLTADDQLVLAEDSSTGRVAGRDLAIAETNLAELRHLDVSETFAPRQAAGYYYRAPGRRGLQIETLEEALDGLPTELFKLIFLEARPEGDDPGHSLLVRATVSRVVERARLGEVIFASADAETLRLIRGQEPGAQICLASGEASLEQQLDLISDLSAEAIVVPLPAAIDPDGGLTAFGRELERTPLAFGSILIPAREPAVFTEDEYQAASTFPFVWGLVSESTLDVEDYARPGRMLVETNFAGNDIDTRRFALGYAKANPYAHVFQRDGIHVNIAAYRDERAPADNPGERRLRRIEERLWNAERAWPFYSGGGVGYVPGIPGDFSAETDYSASRVGQASTLEMAVLNVDPGAHQEPWNADGSKRLPDSIRAKDSFFDPHGAPPYVGAEHDEDDGFRINWNLGTEYDNNQYGRPCGDGTALSARLRLERRGGQWFTAYYRNEQATDWVAVGVASNQSMNERVFLRLAGKRWRQEREDDPSQYHPIVPVDFTFHELRLVSH